MRHNYRDKKEVKPIDLAQSLEEVWASIKKLQPISTSVTTPVQTTVNGSTSGQAIFSEPSREDHYKRVTIYCNALVGTASYTFPKPFVNTPQVVSQSLGGIVTTLSNMAITITGITSTGFIELNGY